MSGLVLLCILPAGTDPGMALADPSAPPLHGLNFQTLSLWIRPAPHPPAPSLEDVRAHHRIVEAAWQTQPAVLPVRFGQWFEGEKELLTAVGPRLGAYEAALARVGGAAEYSVRILDPSAPAEAEPPGDSGTAYLRAAAERGRRRAVAEARGREVAAELRRELGEVVKAERVDPFPSPHGLAAASHLVARERAREYEEGVARFVAARTDLGFLRTGPWPAWSFSE